MGCVRGSPCWGVLGVVLVGGEGGVLGEVPPATIVSVEVNISIYC